MLDLIINKEKCISCGKCVKDCLFDVLAMQDKLPVVCKEEACIKCQHCFAICPTGAISIFGKLPEDSTPLPSKTKVSYNELKTLAKGKRSVRSFKDSNMSREEISELAESALHAPTGVNAGKVRFTIFDDKEKLKSFRSDLLESIDKKAKSGELDESLIFFAEVARNWKEDNKDAIFRNAPHMIVASAPSENPTPKEDCMIALTYFEILASSKGIGTLWCGMANTAINKIAPELINKLNIPKEHSIGYIMLFGTPNVKYARTVQRDPVDIKFLS